MAYETFASTTFDSGGASWEVTLEEEDGTSAQNALAVTGCTRVVGDPQLNPLNPFLRAEVDIRIWDEGRVVWSRLNSALPGSIRLTIKKGGTVWHRGQLRDFNRQAPIRHDNPELELTFDDGLNQLSGGDSYSASRADLLQFFDSTLDVTGVDLEPRVALAFRDTEQSTAVGRSQGQLLDGKFQSGGSEKDALSKVLRFYNLQLFQEEGLWRILQRSYRDAGQSYTYEERDGVQTISGSRDPTVSADGHIAEKDSPAIEGFVGPLGWQQEISTRDRELVFGDVTFTAGSTITAEGTWGKAPKQAGEVDTFEYKIEGEVKVNDTNETGSVTIEIAELRALDPTSGSLYYYDPTANSGSGGWTQTQTPLKATVPEGLAVTTEPFSLTETVNTLPGFGEWVISLELMAPKRDPDGDLNDEIAEITFDTASVFNFERNVTGKDLPADGRALTTTAQSRRTISESLGLWPIEVAGQTFPTAGVEFRDARTGGEFSPLHLDSEAEHVSRALGTENFALLRLYDRYAQTAAPMHRFVGYVERSRVKMRDTVQYDGRQYVPIYRKDDITTERVEMAFAELLNENVPLGAVQTREIRS